MVTGRSSRDGPTQEEDDWCSYHTPTSSSTNPSTGYWYQDKTGVGHNRSSGIGTDGRIPNIGTAIVVWVQYRSRYQFMNTRPDYPSEEAALWELLRLFGKFHLSADANLNRPNLLYCHTVYNLIFASRAPCSSCAQRWMKLQKAS